LRVEVERGTSATLAHLQSLSLIEPNLPFHSLRNEVYVVVGDLVSIIIYLLVVLQRSTRFL